jgi:WD40 repeat protein
LKTSELVNTINGHYDEVSSLVVVGNKIYSGSYDCTLRQWNILDEKEESDKLCELDSDEERELNELLDE